MSLTFIRFLKNKTRDGRRVGQVAFAAAVMFWTLLSVLWGMSLSRGVIKRESSSLRLESSDTAKDLARGLNDRFNALKLMSRMPSVTEHLPSGKRAMTELTRIYPELARVEEVSNPTRGLRSIQGKRPLYLAVKMTDGVGWLRAVLRENWAAGVISKASGFSGANARRKTVLVTRDGARTPTSVAAPTWRELGGITDRSAQPMLWGDGQLWLTSVATLPEMPSTHPPLLVVSAKPMAMIDGRVAQARWLLLAIGITLGALTGAAGWIILRWSTRWLRVANDELERRVGERTAELATAEHSFRSIFENAPFGLYQCDPEGQLLRVNPTFAELLGYPTPEAMIERMKSLHFLGESETRIRFFERLLAEGEVEETMAVEHAEGYRLWLTERARAVYGVSGEIQMFEGAVRDVSAQRALEEQLRKIGATDPLTGLLNRRGLEEEIERAEVPVSLVVLDVDRFKSFNDAYGHPAGDHALQTVAQAMRKTVHEGAVVARTGGEEFVVLLPHTPSSEAGRIAEALREAVASCEILETSLTLSGGVATAKNRKDVREAFAAADRALYLAKQTGRNRIVVNSASLS